jgi:hypothetical protein
MPVSQMLARLDSVHQGPIQGRVLALGPQGAVPHTSPPSQSRGEMDCREPEVLVDLRLWQPVFADTEGVHSSSRHTDRLTLGHYDVEIIPLDKKGWTCVRKLPDEREID